MTDLASEAHALALDADDPLRGFRDRFHIPFENGREKVYFCGNSLGLQPRAARAALETELDTWAGIGVDGHFRGPHPWMHYLDGIRDNLAEVCGALPIEVTAMNSLTVNLHLMMVSFFRPGASRNAILIESGAFSSDRHAVASHLQHHGLDPAECLIELDGDEAGGTLSMEKIERAIAENADRLALVMLPGVQYRTGQAFDIAGITRLAHAAGARVGFDLAHAIGNLRLRLHDDGPDFAVWCHYKYINAGPGAIAGAFVHERHARAGLPRFAGWWGHEAATRFLMRPEFVPTQGAEGWLLSNQAIFSLAPLRAALDIFHEAGMPALREKSLRLTGYLETLIRERLADSLEIVTPCEPERRGAQLSLRVIGGREHGRALFERLIANDIVGDWREPDVIRISPAPLYNRHIDVLRFVQTTEAWRDGMSDGQEGTGFPPSRE